MYKRIRELREDNDLLQKQVAVALGITRQQYGLYESRRKRNSCEKINNISRFL